MTVQLQSGLPAFAGRQPTLPTRPPKCLLRRSAFGYEGRKLCYGGWKQTFTLQRGFPGEH